MNDLIKKIISSKTHLYFISPHLDDAMLSCGDLIRTLAHESQITVINVFTEISPPPLTFSAKAFIKQCGKIDAIELFKQRREEDYIVYKSIGVNVKNLGFIDAQWRKKGKLNFVQKKLSYILPEIIHIYPVYRWHIVNGKISIWDKKMMENIKISILDIINKNANYLVFCPIGVGGNVDHRIVRNCCLDIFDKNIILWSDFPYNSKHKLDFKDVLNYREFIFNFDKFKKEELIKLYRSQYEALINDGMGGLADERYYLKNY